MLKVSKFGGSSVKEASAMVRCSNIIKADSSIKLAVISATYNSTNQLEKMANLSATNQQIEVEKMVELFFERHQKLAHDLGLVVDDEIRLIIAELRKNLDEVANKRMLSSDMMDEIYAIGERVSSLIFAAHLDKVLMTPVKLVDARDFIVTDETYKRARPLMKELEERVLAHIKPLIEKGILVVTQGFVGRTLSGKTTTLGREGSDYTGALFAWALNASELQIWTDVAGMYTADPNIDKTAIHIDTISYDKAYEMCAAGAKVLFPDTMRPVQERAIPIYVASTLDPEKPGTRIWNF